MKAIQSLKYLLPVLLAGTISNGMAQETGNDPTKGAVTEEIEVVRAYRPVLADAVKIRRSPDLQDNRPFKPNLSYSILDKKLELNTDIRQLQAQALEDEKAPVLINNYVKAGAGNFNTGLGEIYVNTGKDEALQAGAYFRHLSQQGSMTGQKFSGQEFKAFGRSVQDKFTVNGEAGYDGKSSNFYGADPAIPSLTNSIQKQRYDVFSAKGELLKKYQQNPEGLDYAVKADAYLLKDSYQARENSILLSGFVSKTFNSFNAGSNISLDFTSVKDSLYAISNNILRINPFVRFKGQHYSLTIGANLVHQFGTSSASDILPSVTAELHVVPEFATLFAGYTGDALKTSIFELSRENPYLNKNITVKNALQKSNIYGGVRGNAGSGFGYKAMVYYKTIENMPLLANDPDIRKFNVLYDKKTEVLGIEGEISVNASGILIWTSKVNVNSYNLETEQEAWFKPGLLVSSNLRFSLNKKFTINSEVLLNGGSKALTYETVPVVQKSVISVKSYADLSAGAEYRFREKLGFYIQANNLFGTNYQRYLYYPVIGLNVFGGLNYSF